MQELVIVFLEFIFHYTACIQALALVNKVPMTYARMVCFDMFCKQI